MTARKAGYQVSQVLTMQDQTEWVILDTETDGLDYPIHVLEVAAQRMRGRSKDGESFRVFLNHRIPIPPMATAIHGYTEEFLEKHGIDPGDAHEQLRAYVGNRYIVAHYLRYDWNGVLLPEWRRLQVSQIGQAGFCTWNLSRRVIPECCSHRLDLLREQFGFPTAEAHSAIGDIESVFRLLEEVVFPRLERVGVSTFSDFVRFSAEKPLLKCHCLIEGKDYAKETRKIQETRRQQKAEEEARQRRGQAILEAIVSGLISDVPAFIRSRGLITQDPEIDIEGRSFLFTGKMIWGSRTHATQVVESLGGIVSKSKTVSGKIDFLVLGEDSQAGWTSLLHGGKLIDAMSKKLEDDHCRFSIILESDFIDCLMGQLGVAENKQLPHTG